MATDKGQHLRLLIMEGTPATGRVAALSTDLTLHLSATTENSSTKDTTDTNGNYNEYDVTQRSGDIQFGALVGVGTDTGGKSFADFLSSVNDSLITWKIMSVSGTNNRTPGKTLCSGQGKLVNISAQAQNRTKVTYTGGINIYGPVEVGTD
jgi:hypothetical protein